MRKRRRGFKPGEIVTSEDCDVGIVARLDGSEKVYCWWGNTYAECVANVQSNQDGLDDFERDDRTSWVHPCSLVKVESGGL